MTVIKFRGKKPSLEANLHEMNLNELLNLAVNLKDRSDQGKENVTDLKKHVSERMMNVLIKEKMVESESILCGIYVSNLLGSLCCFTPQSWYATDHFINNPDNPCQIQQGADICFLICSLFPERGNRRSMKTVDYRFFGIGLFMHFYHLTGKEIGYHMSTHFEPMVEAAKRCVNEI